MKGWLKTIWLPVLAMLVGAAVVGWWLMRTQPVEMALRLPVAMDDPPPTSRPANPGALGKLEAGPGQASEHPGRWPGFRGSRRDGISDDPTPLANRWAEGGPRQRWSISVGDGYAGVAIWDGRAYLLDYDLKLKADVVRCLSLDDGRDIWTYRYPVRVKRNHGMSRTVPAVNERYLVTIGPKCQVVCLDPVSGKLLWARDLTTEFGTVVPEWYAGQCPLLEKDRVVLAPAGSAMMVALDAGTGEVLWQTSNPRKWSMSHASITPMMLDGRLTYVYLASGGVLGVDAQDGRLLWDTDAWKINIATICSAVDLGEGRVFLAGGYGSGAMLLQISRQEDRYVANVVYRLPPSVFGATQHTPIYYQGHLYGVRPDGRFTCLSPDGKPRWVSAAGTQYGLGPFMIVDGKILVMDDHGTLSMMKANSQAYEPLAQAKVLEGPEAWGPLAPAGGWLLARDLTRLLCLDLTKASAAASSASKPSNEP